MERRLKDRSISVIVYDEVMPLQYRALDFIHFAQQRHTIINAVKWYRTESDTNSGMTWSSIRPQCEGRRQHAEFGLWGRHPAVFTSAVRLSSEFKPL